MRSPVNRIEFEQLEWKYLEPFLSSYRKSELSDVIVESEQIHVPDRTEFQVPLRLKAYVKDLSFKMGYVSLFHYLEPLGRDIEIQIPNRHILPEFDFIKHFFAKQLNRKTIEIDGQVLIRGNQVIEVKATSPQVKRINGSMIETMKWTQVKGLKEKSLVKTIDKSLFTAEEAWDLQDTTAGKDAFRLNVAEIIETLSTNGVVRNRKQLIYLAGYKQSNAQKIYLTLNPIFGFLFAIDGIEMHHFCWELLNSHATYLWSAPRDEWSQDGALKAVEQVIQQIRSSGRERYKQAYWSGVTTSQLLFHAISHRYADSKLVDAFPLWKNRLEERLV